MNNALAFVALSFAAPARAQEYRQAQARAAQAAYEAMQAAAAEASSDARRAAQGSKIRAYALDATLTAMNDGPAAGGAVARALAERKTDVYFAMQKEPVAAGTVNGRAAILLSDLLPARPRVYAPLIAAEAAKGMYQDMPACAEREYMRTATAARVFAELGGDFKALPKVDGEDAPAVAAAVADWARGAEAALDEVSRRTGLPTIPELRAKAADPKTAAALDAADKAFVAFLLDERDARAAAGLR